MRADPPALAGDAKRRPTFVAALEQAEQLVRSAAQMGPETRPINLYYGLSQGARAVAAALDPDSTTWQLRGHGITHVGSLDKRIIDISIQDSGEPRGSFTRLASLMGSASLPEPVAFGDVLAALPIQVPISTWSDRPRAVLIEHIPPSDGLVLTSSPYAYARTQGWPLHPAIGEADVAGRRDVLARLIAERYPTLRGVEPLPEGYERLAVGSDDLQFVFRVTAEQHVGSDAVRELMIYSRTTLVAGRQFAFPAFGASPQPCQPLLLLWATLWTMSMLARYEPVRWAKALNVDKSTEATGLEEILEDSLSMVPWALADALAMVSGHWQDP
jgi:hypothetical protein